MLKLNKTLRTGVALVGLIGIGALLFVGFSPLGEQDLASQIEQNPLLLDVPVMQQSIGTSCGEAAIAIAYNYAFPQRPISEQEAIDFATNQGYFTPGVPPYTSPANMVKIAEHYAEEVASGTARDPEHGLKLLVENLQAGTPVIIDVLTIFSDPESEAHFIVVTGLSVDPNLEDGIVVHYNDPLTGTRDTALWSGPTGVWNAWQNNGDPGGPGWWLAIPPP